MPTEIDFLFRNIMLLCFAVIVPCAAYFRIRSNATKEKLNRREEGMVVLIGLRLFGAAGMLSMIAFLIDPAYMSWSSFSLPLWVRWLGVTRGVCSGFLWIYTFHHLGKNLTDTVVTRKEHTLITSGPYRWVRHPFYVSFALLIFANTFAAANWFIFLTCAAAFVFIVIRTDKEEANLIARFGDSYKEYMARTGRFFPRFK